MGLFEYPRESLRKIIKFNQFSTGVVLTAPLLEFLGWKKGDKVSVVAIEKKELSILKDELKDGVKILVVKKK